MWTGTDRHPDQWGGFRCLKGLCRHGKAGKRVRQDYAGNRSKTVKFENPYYEEPAPTEKPAAATQQNQGGAEDDEDFEDDGYGEGFDPDEAYGGTEYLSEDDFEDRINDEQEDSE